MISPTATKPNGSAKPRARVADESSDALAPSRPAPSARPTGGVPPSKQFQSFSEASSFLWSIADLLRGDLKEYDDGKVILPFTVLRRLDCVLADTKDEVLAKGEKLEANGVKDAGPVLRRITGTYFYNVSKLDFQRLLDDPNHIASNLAAFVRGFSEDVQEIFLERFKFLEQVARAEVDGERTTGSVSQTSASARPSSLESPRGLTSGRVDWYSPTELA